MNTKTILALGPRGSNGHEAALQAQKLIDANADWKIEFCDKNSEILATAIDQGSYAVVPFENTSGGPVKTITDSLFKTCGRDSKVRVIGEIPIRIVHCLLARNQEASRNPTKVISHIQGLIQCKQFLSSKGWDNIKEDVSSTSGAAQRVAGNDEYANAVAIASAFAAKEHGLKIIEQGIQDSVENVTRFAILAPTNEPALMENVLRKVTVTIVGADGGYGKWPKAFFELHGCTVLSVDIDTPFPDGENLVRQAHVVIFSVPTLEAKNIIESFVSASNKDQLWLDITSLKVEAVQAMLTSSAEVVGLHPLCAPPRVLSLKGQTLAVCAERLSKWGPWLASLLTLLESDIDITSSEEHDYLVAERQALPHALMFIEGAVMETLGVNVAESLRVASPFYKILLAATCRMHAQSPKVYAGIQIGNPHTLRVLETLQQGLDRLIGMVKAKNQEGFITEFNRHRKHIGDETLKQGNEAFAFMIELLADLSAKNSITVESIVDTPGLLVKLASVIASHGVSMTSMHTRPTKSGAHQFVIGVDHPVNSGEMHATIKEINESGIARVL